MARKNQTRNRAIFVIALLAGLWMVGIFSPFGLDSPIGINILEGKIVPPVGQTAPHKFTLTKRGTSTAVESATVYAHFDWNGNGMVDLGEYPEGEIETLTSAATTGLVTTGVEYPIGRPILYQVHKTGYEVETFSRTRTSVPAAYDGSALVVPSCFLTLTDTGTSRVSINGELLVTATTDYNYTLSGAEPSVEFVHTATSSDAGINEKAFTHWGNGKDYAGTMVIATFTVDDFLDLVPSGYSGMFTDGTTVTAWWDVAGYFYDADDASATRYTLDFALDINDAGDIATIGIYNGIESSDLGIGIIGTALGTYETGLDIVA